MNDSQDVPKKTSRRRFTKTAASALVAMPVIASLSSCKDKSVSPPSPPGTPTPRPTGTPSPESSNPPIIIDGGSLSISLDTRLQQVDTHEPPRTWKHTQQDRVYGAITRIRLMNEYGDAVRPGQLDFPVGVSDSLELKIWLQTAGDENAAGEVTYDPVSAEPQFLLTNTGESRTFEIRYVEKIDNPDKVYKKKRPQKKYRREKLKAGTGTILGKVFRIGKVGIKVAANSYETDASAADEGFRIVVFMKNP